MAHMELTVRLPVIGVVRTSHRELETTPIQAGLNRAEHGTIEIAEPYRDGLDGLADFSCAWLLSWLHRPRDPAGDAPLRQVPFLLRRQQRTMGIFATRGPRRVNPIGLSLIQLYLEVTGQPSCSPCDLSARDTRSPSRTVTRIDRPPGDTRDVELDRERGCASAAATHSARTIRDLGLAAAAVTVTAVIKASEVILATGD